LNICVCVVAQSLDWLLSGRVDCRVVVVQAQFNWLKNKVCFFQSCELYCRGGENPIAPETSGHQ
jgi:hypothetical protein